MVKFSIESCNSKETKALPVGRRGPINSMGWRVPINSKHVLSWSHLCLKPPSMSHAQPYVRVAHTRIVVVTPLLKARFYEPCTAIRLRCSYQTALHKGVWPRHYVPMPFSYITHTHTHAHTPTHTFPLYCILGTIGPIEPKFCMHMECDQTIKSHKNINLIWGPSWLCKWRSKVKSSFVLYLSNLGSHWARFCVLMECDQANICHITSSWYEAILAMQMKVKGQIFLCFVSQKWVGLIEPKFCMRMGCDQTIKSHKNINLIWAILVMQMKVKGQIFLCFVSRFTGDQFSPRFWYVVAETIPLQDIWHLFFILMTSSQWKFSISGTFVRLSPNFVCTWSVIRQLFHEITPTSLGRHLRGRKLVFCFYLINHVNLWLPNFAGTWAIINQ